jgi:carbonic anhydrase/acetyltransferase-like protein (isoleucine patch superfamily)
MHSKNYPFALATPRIGPDVYIAPGAVLVGDVDLGRQTSVWFNAVLRADIHSIRIGSHSNVQDGAVLHVADSAGIDVGDWVTIGHAAVLHACQIEDEVLVGMNSVILDGARVGARSIVGANALVKAGMCIPPGSMVLGSPAKVVRSLSEEEQESLREWASRYVRLAEAYRRGQPRIVMGQVSSNCVPPDAALPSSSQAGGYDI